MPWAIAGRELALPVTLATVLGSSLLVIRMVRRHSTICDSRHGRFIMESPGSCRRLSAGTGSATIGRSDVPPRCASRGPRVTFRNSPKNATQEPVTILGAGIVGICTALSLRERGVPVQVIDRGDPGQATSYGNAGVVSPWSFICLLYTSPSPRDATLSRMPSSA